MPSYTVENMSIDELLAQSAHEYQNGEYQSSIALSQLAMAKISKRAFVCRYGSGALVESIKKAA